MSPAGVLPAHDAQERLALRGIGTPIDDGQCLTIAFVDRAGKAKDPREPQPIEGRVAMMSLIDLDADDC